MVVVRAEDPTWSGSPWGAPAAGQILWPRVLTNVGAGATVPPGGFSAIPLARIDMPASQSTVQQSYIHDLRQVCNESRVTQLYVQAGPVTQANSTLSTTTPAAWPPASWQVPIPAYATAMTATWGVYEVIQNGEGDGWARGNVMVIFGASVTSPVLTTTTTMYSIPTTLAAGAHTIGGASYTPIPAALRGTTQTMQMSQITLNHGSSLGFREGSSASVLIQFRGQASLT